MPRPKTINTTSIKLEKINKAIVERKNCLRVEIVFKTAFTTDQIAVLSGFYGFGISSNGKVLSGKVKNSWKSLISLFVSVAYCKYGDKVVARIWNGINHTKRVRDLNLRVDFLYEQFINKKELEEIHKRSIPHVPQEEIAEALQNREQYEIKLEQRRLETFLGLLKDRVPDPTFENVIAPDSWRPCYMSAKYKPMDIVDYIKLFSKLLEINGKMSIIQTDFAKQLPHKYETHPAVYRDDSKWRT